MTSLHLTIFIFSLGKSVLLAMPLDSFFVAVFPYVYFMYHTAVILLATSVKYTSQKGFMNKTFGTLDITDSFFKIS